MTHVASLYAAVGNISLHLSSPAAMQPECYLYGVLGRRLPPHHQLLHRLLWQILPTQRAPPRCRCRHPACLHPRHVERCCVLRLAFHGSLAILWKPCFPSCRTFPWCVSRTGPGLVWPCSYISYAVHMLAQARSVRSLSHTDLRAWMSNVDALSNVKHDSIEPLALITTALLHAGTPRAIVPDTS